MHVISTIQQEYAFQSSSWLAIGHDVTAVMLQWLLGAV
jgi:hypothetical protein